MYSNYILLKEPGNPEPLRVAFPQVRKENEINLLYR